MTKACQPRLNAIHYQDGKRLCFKAKILLSRHTHCTEKIGQLGPELVVRVVLGLHAEPN